MVSSLRTFIAAPSLLAALLRPAPVRGGARSLRLRDAPLGTPCSFCADGVTVTGDFATTCKDMVEFAVNSEEESETCSGIKELEAMCCPTPAAKPCPFCAEGITAGDDGFVIPEDGFTCKEVVDYAVSIEEASETCSEIKGIEVLCCPTPAERPCPLCPGGITVGDDFIVVDEGDQTLTCEDVVVYATSIEEASETCSEIKGIAAICCPAPVENPCTLCSAGVTAGDGAVVPGDGDGATTCKDAVDYAVNVEESSETCSDIKGVEAFCCPTPVKSPCPICTDRVTAGDDVIVSDDEGNTFTCKDAVDYAVNVEESSEACSDIKGVEAVCCPTPVKSPCPICTDGVTVRDDVVVSDDEGDTFTCKDAVDYAVNVEESSETCSDIKRLEAICCPTPVQDPCTLCSRGITADEGFVVFGTDGMTCQALAKNLMAAEASSDACSESKYAEIFCCWTPAKSPCPVCTAGFTADDRTPLPDADGATCGDMAYYAPGAEELSDTCAFFKEEAKLCCPAPGEDHRDEEVTGPSKPKYGSKADKGKGSKAGKHWKDHESSEPKMSESETSNSKASKAKSSKSKSSKAKDKSRTSRSTANQSTPREPSTSQSITSKSKDLLFRGPKVSHRDSFFRGRFREP